MRTVIQCAALLSALTLVNTALASADIEALPTFPGSIGNFPNDINDQGNIVGTAYIDSFSPSAVIWQGGEIKVLPGGGWGDAKSINSRNQIAGITYTENGQPQPTVWTNNKPVRLPTIGFGGYANSINNRGETVGWVWSLFGKMQPALWRDGRLTILSFPSQSDAQATGIDDSGLISGEIVTSLTGRVTPVQWTSTSSIFGVSGFTNSTFQKIGHAVSSTQTSSGESVITGRIIQPSNQIPTATVWRNRWMRKLPNLSQVNFSEAYSTNRNGTTFGYSIDAEGQMTAVFWNEEGATRLPKLGPAVSIAYSGNSQGEIVGISTDETGNVQPVRWRMTDLTRLTMRSFQTGRSRSITLSAKAVRGTTPVAGSETEFQLNGKTVGFAKTNREGVASIVVPVNGSKEGNHQIMASLGGSKYIFRSWVNGRSEPDLQVQSATGRRNQNVQIRFKLVSDELGTPLANRRVRVWLGSRELGFGITAANGEGTATFRLTNFPIGNHRLDLRFSGDGTSFGGSSTSDLTVTP